MMVLYIRPIWLFAVLFKVNSDVVKNPGQNPSHVKASQSNTRM